MTPTHRTPKHAKTCRVCGVTFQARSTLAATCYAEACQLAARRAMRKAREAGRRQ